MPEPYEPKGSRTVLGRESGSNPADLVDYTSAAFRKVLKKRDAIQSMSSTGRCYDNARMESAFAMLKKEKLYRIDTRAMRMDEVKTIIFRYIAYYNRRRICMPNGGWPPMVYRERYAQSAA